MNEKKKKEVVDWKELIIQRMGEYYVLSLSENYPALELLKTKIITDIESLLKDQRKICAEQYEFYNCLKDSERFIKDKVLNAPPPTGK